MIDTLKAPFEDVFLNKIANTKKKLLLCAPFIKETTIEKNFKGSTKKCKT